MPLLKSAKEKVHEYNARLPLKYFALSTLSIWSIIVGILLIWNIATEKKGNIHSAKVIARTLLKKDMIYRNWNSLHGGVYVPVTKDTQPNKYLGIERRDVDTAFGVKLTKINPAYMTRQVYELSNNVSGVKGHITSLNPLRPENFPDAWEKRALTLFKAGKKEFSSSERNNGEVYFRFILPLVNNKQCLQCHAVQGEKLGSIRGGLSVSIPFLNSINIEKRQIHTLCLIYFLLWVSGTIGGATGFYILKQKIRNLNESLIKLSDQEKMQGVLEMAGAVCHELNQPLQEALTASEMIQDKINSNSSIDEELVFMIDGLEKMGTITDKLMQVTKYKTKKYLKGEIIDLDEASDFNNHKKF
jgi:hypothetical protein